ncbi:MAG: DUF1365 domain-containing protein [Acidobacteria bacterium]|nr:DUF1365 domain-containing protein [Acidobacteriota bacterium]
MESAIYTGTLRHRRFQPARHDFTYPLFMMFLDIDRIPELMKVSPFASHNRFNWASFDDQDHFGDPALPLRERLKADAARHDVRLPDGAIFVLTNLRYLGYNFNPISLFYCYDAEGRLGSVLAEVNNTFGESLNYWLSAASVEHQSRPHVYRCPKSMHVSPFMPMKLDYRFVLPPPGDRLVAHMSTLDGEHASFDATLTLHRETWSAPALHRALRRFPWMTAKVITAIHWEALKLYVKKVPVYTHPARCRENKYEHVSRNAR